jgi:hypothetical protein
MTWNTSPFNCGKGIRSEPLGGFYQLN